MTAALDVSEVVPGGTLVLRVDADPTLVVRLRVWDLSGTTWTQVAATPWVQTWIASPSVAGSGEVVVGSLRSDGSRYRDRVSYTVLGSGTAVPATGGPLIGMHAPADL